MNADLSKLEKFLQDRTVVLADRVSLFELSELVLVPSVSTGVERSFGRVEFEFDEFVVDRREGKNRFAVFVLRIFRPAKREVTHDDLEPFSAESFVDLRVSFTGLVRFDQVADVLIPN